MDRITDLLILGGGNMGSAIALACASAGVRVCVVEPSPAARADLASRARASARATITISPELASAMQDMRDALRARSACVIIAVKPQVFPAVAPDVAKALATFEPVVLSIMAGVTTRAIEAALPGTRVLRAMPNLGAAIQRSTTALCSGATASPHDREAIAALIEHFGTVEHIDESLMDAFTALAGSGPAFLFYLAQAMAQGGVDAGFSDQQARRIVAHTLDAAARLLVEPHNGDGPSHDAAAWRARVTSKKGTTQAAMESLDAEDVMAAVARAVVAGRDRGRELGSNGGGAR